MSADLQVLAAPVTVDSEIKKSRFIGVAMPCESEQQAMQQLRKLATEHSNANHLAFAWRIRQPEGFITERFYDAGEPSGNPVIADAAWPGLSLAARTRGPSKNPVSGGMARSGCESNIIRNNVVPDRGTPTITGNGGRLGSIRPAHTMISRRCA